MQTAFTDEKMRMSKAGMPRTHYPGQPLGPLTWSLLETGLPPLYRSMRLYAGVWTEGCQADDPAAGVSVVNQTLGTFHPCQTTLDLLHQLCDIAKLEGIR